MLATLAQEPASEGYKLDRYLMVYVLAGTAILCLSILAIAAIERRNASSRFSPLSGNMGPGELMIGLAVLGVVSALAIPAFISPEVLTTVIGTLIGTLLGSPWRSRSNRDAIDQQGQSDADAIVSS